MSFQLQYLTDPEGKRSAVLLPIKDWENIQKDLMDLELLKNKKMFFEGLTDALKEVYLIRQGLQKPKSFDEMINEL